MFETKVCSTFLLGTPRMILAKSQSSRKTDESVTHITYGSIPRIKQISIQQLHLFVPRIIINHNPTERIGHRDCLFHRLRKLKPHWQCSRTIIPDQKTCVASVSSAAATKNNKEHGSGADDRGGPRKAAATTGDVVFTLRRALVGDRYDGWEEPFGDYRLRIAVHNGGTEGIRDAPGFRSGFRWEQHHRRCRIRFHHRCHKNKNKNGERGRLPNFPCRERSQPRPREGYQQASQPHQGRRQKHHSDTRVLDLPAQVRIRSGTVEVDHEQGYLL